MQSFRTEIENPIVEKDILDLEKKIRQFKEGKIHEEKFRSLRLARGVYGQRQPGVQMIRIKLPFGKVSARQLLRIADVSDHYSNGKLHLTTRQDIQIHYVSLDRTPELWTELEKDDVTLREACGNTVRNITASPESGIDPGEAFDVSPYANALFAYFLRKPFGQELGRKIKIAFSNHEKDTAYTYIHDFGFIPKTRTENNIRVKGFKVLVGGGLGAQPFLAQVAFEFLPANRIIPFVESALRVFDRYGERASRHKARLKYLVQKTGLDGFLKLVEEEEKALTHLSVEIGDRETEWPVPPVEQGPGEEQDHIPAYLAWLRTNTFEQKQKGFYGVYIKIQLGNLATFTARKLAELSAQYADQADLRITINQGFLFRNVLKPDLPRLFRELSQLGLADPGFGSTADITACPGTDTCNLAISNSTVISVELEKVITEEFPELIYNHDLKIKISGCMNSCGQHGLANIGFHGSSFKIGSKVVPALQVLLGGWTVGDGEGRVSEKVIKVASRRAPDVLRTLFRDFEENALEHEYFNVYYDRKGKDYFYQLLKPVADSRNLGPADFIDWGQEEQFATAIGVGECAGVMIDLVSTLFFESEEKLAWSAESLDAEAYSDSIYYTYASLISSAKALLLDRQVHVNTHHALITDFDTHFAGLGFARPHQSFRDLVLQINKHQPGRGFAEKYFEEAQGFLEQARDYRLSHPVEAKEKN